jgi:hypothetical protein
VDDAASSAAIAVAAKVAAGSISPLVVVKGRGCCVFSAGGEKAGRGDDAGDVGDAIAGRRRVSKVTACIGAM